MLVVTFIIGIKCLIYFYDWQQSYCHIVFILFYTQYFTEVLSIPPLIETLTTLVSTKNIPIQVGIYNNPSCFVIPSHDYETYKVSHSASPPVKTHTYIDIKYTIELVWQSRMCECASDSLINKGCLLSRPTHYTDVECVGHVGPHSHPAWLAI